MLIGELLAYLRVNIPFSYIADDFTLAADDPVRGYGDEYAIVRLTGGHAPSQWTPKAHPSFQVIVRGKPTGQAVAEAKAEEIRKHFHQRSAFFIGNTRVVTALADQSSIIKLGVDLNKRPLYSINFTLTTI